MSNRPLRIAASTSSKYGPTISASVRPRPSRAADVVRDVGHVDGPDHVVVRVAGEMVADLVLAADSYVISTPNRMAIPCGPSARPPRGPSAPGPEREPIGRGARVEVDVIGDRQLGDPALDGGGRVDVDRDVAVGREVRVEVGVERQVARLADPRLGSAGSVTPRSAPARGRPGRTRRARVSSCSSVWAAVTIVRMRALSSATVGKTTGWAKTPSSNSRPLNRLAPWPSRPSSPA